MSSPSTLDQLSPLQRALLALEKMQAKLSALQRANSEPLAIIGIACRFPGGSDTPDAFWRMLRAGTDAITEVPRDRWDVDAYYDPNPDAPGKMHTRCGGFIDGIDQFDPAFFGISPREAVGMDPQQRLLLEVCWEALERAGQAPRDLSGSRTAVFVGISTNDYAQIPQRFADPLATIDAYTGTGVSFCVASGRLSYVLGLQGPNLALDTACSSSLVAVHLGCRSLRSRESDLAVVGGVNAMLGPEATIYFSKVRAMSPGGRCKTFDASADGYVRGEGCGVLVLKRLSDAIADRDNVVAVIRGTAINHDGRSSGLTVPNAAAQEAVIRAALADAQVDPAEVGYIEAHGTGTPLGDPIEVRTLAAVLREGRRPGERVALGSVKTNIGHLEAAAGVAGLIKVALSLQHAEFVPHLHLRERNVHVPWHDIPVDIPTAPCPWPEHRGRRIAGVSSFGFSGTNAHVVLEEAPPQPPAAEGPERPLHILTLSAKNREALRELARRFAEDLAAEGGRSLADICYTANTGRAHFAHRLAAIASSAAEMRSQLASFADGGNPPGLTSEIVSRRTVPKVAFLFGGGGSPFVGMGRDLFETQPVFRSTFEQCEERLRARGSSPLTEPQFAAPAQFAFEYALAALWRSWGIEPAGVFGAGVGEYVAACAAGVLSLDAALDLVVAYGSSAPAVDAFERCASAIEFQIPQQDWVSETTGALVEGRTIDARHWMNHLRLPRRTADGVQALHALGYDVFVEIAPGSTLLNLLEERLPSARGLRVKGLRAGRSDWLQLLEGVAALYAHGIDPNWAGFDRGYHRRKVALPTYPFQRSRYWVEETAGQSVEAVCPMLGARLRMPLVDGVRFESRISVASPSFLNDHRIAGVHVVPGSAYLELATAAASAVFGTGAHRVEDVVFQSALALTDASPRRLVHVIVTREAGGALVTIHSLDETTDDDTAWTEHATGRIVDMSGAPGEPAAASLPRNIVETFRTEIPARDYYEELRARGLEYGPAFSSIQRLWSRDSQALGQLQLPATETAAAAASRLHPGLLDSCFQVLGVALKSSVGAAPDDTHTFVPIGVERYRVHAAGATRVWALVNARPQDPGRPSLFIGDLRIFDDAGALVAEIEGLRVAKVSREALKHTARSDAATDDLYTLRWQRSPGPPDSNEADAADSAAPRRWLIVANGDGIGTALAARLGEGGDVCVVVGSHGDAEDPDGFRRLLTEPDARRYTGIIFLSDGDAATRIDIATVRQAQLDGCRGFLHLVQALIRTDGPLPRLFMVTRGAQPVLSSADVVSPERAPLWGLGQVVALEHPELRCVCVDLDPARGPEEIPALAAAILGPDREDRIALRGGTRYVSRLTRAARSRAYEPLQLGMASKGRLDTLVLNPAPRRAPGPNEVEIRVAATGLNFRDVLDAMDLYPGDAGPLGIECAGRIVARGADVTAFDVGDEVAALASGAFATFVTTSAASLMRKPKELSWSDAATMPVAFLTAIYGLDHLARIKAGDRVLIHSAAGGVGLAAVQVAQRAGADVFATAGNPEKRAFLTSLGVRHVFDSRTLEFAEEVRRLTGGRGVDIVLNWLSGESIAKSLSTLAPGGRFIEIGKRGIWDPAQVAAARPDVAYSTFDLAAIAATDPTTVQGLLSELGTGLAARTLRPLPCRRFALRNAVSAFRAMARATHIGKIVLTQDLESSDRVWRTNATYLVTGGVGGLGLRVAARMVEQGARHLVLVARRPPSLEASAAVRELEAGGARVVIAQADVSREADVVRVLGDISTSMPALGGIVHAAGTLDDGIVARQAWGRFERVMAPKVDGVWHLHEHTRLMDLDFFVCFSSVASVLGSPGQSNYAAANSFLDAFAHYRRAQGLQCLTINWGPWAATGMTADENDRRRSRGLVNLAPSRALDILETLLQHRQDAQVVAVRAEWPTLLAQFPAGEEPTLLADLGVAARASSPGREPSGRASDLRVRLDEAEPSDREALLVAYLRAEAIRILGLHPSHPLDVGQPLTELGFDSLMTVELINDLAFVLKRKLPLTLFVDCQTVGQVAAHLARSHPMPEGRVTTLS